MNRLLFLTLSLNACLIALLLAPSSEIPLAAAARSGVATENGDLNADGVRDISDAVHMLIWLFRDGDPPAPIAPLDADPGFELTPEQEEILDLVSLVETPIDEEGNTVPTVRITGANLQIVNGTGKTGSTTCITTSGEPCPTGNGTGNLIIGYQELRGEDDDRSGSHNVVIGSKNNYTKYGGLVVGEGNDNRALYGFVAGAGNKIYGSYTSIFGGSDNMALGEYNSIAGGHSNIAGGDACHIAGGIDNDAYGDQTTVVGGRNNSARGTASSVVGGQSNYADANAATVAGGYEVHVTTDYRTAVGILEIHP